MSDELILSLPYEEIIPEDELLKSIEEAQKEYQSNEVIKAKSLSDLV